MQKKMESEFKNPPKEYKPVPFWSLNDDLQDKELVRQIKEMDEHGWGGFFLHSREGLITPYLSEEWMNRMNTCIKEAKKRGMGAWLYDEDRFASGFAGGLIPAMGKEYGMKALKCTLKGEEVESEIYYYSPNEWHNGYSYTDLIDPVVVDAFIESTYEAYYKKFGKDFGKAIPGIFTDEPHFFANADLGEGIYLIPWTTGFPDYFKKKKGYDIREKLELLFIKKEGCEKVRYDYKDVLSDLFLDTYTKKVYYWCEEHNLEYTGHYYHEDNYDYQINHLGSVMPHYEYMHVPGIDHLCDHQNDLKALKQVSSVAHQLGRNRVLCELYGCSGQDLSFTGRKWIGDWHLVLGINLFTPHLSLYSMKGSRKRDYPPNIFWQQPWWKYNNIIEDHLSRVSFMLTRGKHKCDILMLHTIESAWAVSGNTKDPGIANDLSDELEKLSKTLLMMQRDFDYGDEKLMEKYASLAWENVILGKKTIREARIRVGECLYKAVVIPPAVTLRRRTFELLRDFVNGGGKVIAIEKLPTLVDCVYSEELKNFINNIIVSSAESNIINDKFDSILEPEILIETIKEKSLTPIYYNHRIEGDKDIFFFCNTDKEKGCNTKISFKIVGKVQEWDTFSGKIKNLPSSFVKNGNMQINIDFLPSGSHLIVVDRAKSPLKLNAKKDKRREVCLKLGDKWNFTRKDMNALTLDYCKYKIEDMQEWSQKIPIWKVQRKAKQEIIETGKQAVDVKMQIDFDLGFDFKKTKKLFFVLENPQAYYLIKVNGKKIMYKDIGWWTDTTFKKINIASLAKKGMNTVELSCDFRSPVKPGTRIYVKDGVELESCYVVGDFAVMHENRRDFSLMSEKAVLLRGDLVDQGYPFFTGTIRLSQDLIIKKEKNKVYFLHLEEFNATVANIFINKKSAGTIIFPLYKLDVTELIKNGKNNIEIELTNNLRNLLGPHHSNGEMWGICPESFSDEQNWTDDYVFVKYGI